MTRTEIKILLLKKGINQTELSQRVGISPQTLCDILAGRRKTEKYQLKIATIFDLPIEKLFPNSGGKK